MGNQLSLQQVVKFFGYLAAGHDQIESFYYGPKWDADVVSENNYALKDGSTSNTPIYPIMIVIPQKSKLYKDNLTLSHKIQILDQVQPDASNRIPLLSDNLQTLLDIKAFIYKDFGTIGDGIFLTDDSDIEPYFENYNDYLAGWSMDLDVKIDWLADVCTIPGLYPNDVAFQGTNGFYSINLANYLPLTGGILSGPLSGTSIDMNYYYSGGTPLYTVIETLIQDFTGNTFNTVQITGGTYNNGDLFLENTTGGTVTISGFTNPVPFITGGSYNNSLGLLNLINQTGSSISISGFYTGYTPLLDIRVTGGTYNVGSGIATFTNNTGGTFNVIGFYTGYTAPQYVYITGGTYTGGTLILNNNTGGTVNVTGFTTGTTISSWNLTGNSGTNTSTDFIGTIDNVSLIFKIDSVFAGGLAAGSGGVANTSLGYNSNQLQGAANTNIGVDSQYYLTTGQNNTAVGYNSLETNQTGFNNVGIGYNAGLLGLGNNPNNSTFIGYGSGAGLAVTNSMALGYNSAVSGDNQVVIGIPSITGLTFWGSLNPNNNSGLSGQTLTSRGNGLSPVWTSNNYWGISGNTGTNPSSNWIGTLDNVALAFRVDNFFAGIIDNGVTFNTTFGTQSNSGNIGSHNTAMGYQSMGGQYVGSTGNYNVAMGYYALANVTSGDYNAIIGAQSVRLGYPQVNYTSTLGGFALYNTNGVDRNVGVGYSAGYNNTTGSSNTFVGYSADSISTFSNTTVLGANGVGTASNQMNIAGSGITSFVIPNTTGSAPTNPNTPVLWEKVIISGTTYFIPLYQ